MLKLSFVVLSRHPLLGIVSPQALEYGASQVYCLVIPHSSHIHLAISTPISVHNPNCIVTGNIMYQEYLWYATRGRKNLPVSPPLIAH